MTNYRLWTQLGTHSRRALLRRTKRFGHPYTYSPRGNLLARLAATNGMSVEQVYRELMELRTDLLQSDD
jgi:hypothetical protein